MATIVGDTAVGVLLGYGTYRFIRHLFAGDYATLRYHTSDMPPALLAEKFDFEDVAQNRTLPREELEKYRAEVSQHKGPVEDIIFKY